MRKMSLTFACMIALFAAPLAAQQPQVDFPPEPRAESPRTFAEQNSPVSFGTTVIAGGDGHLMVADVSDGSIAAQAGLRTGDHIVSIDGQLLTEPATFNEYVAARPAAPLNIIVLRDGKQETIVVHPAGAATTTTTGDSHSRPALGLRFMQSPQVIISETVIGSPAADSGLLAGDQLISVNGDVVTSSDQFITLVAAASLSEPLELGVVRGAERSTVSITPAAWETVFTSTDSYTTLKPLAPATTAVAPTIGCGAYAAPWYNPYYISNVSPVVVPLAWYGYYPYSVYPSGYTYWNVYNPGNIYYSVWPNGPYYSGPYPGPVHEAKPAAKELDSAGAQRGESTVSRLSK